MGKTREISKKIRDTKGTFNGEFSTVKDRNNMDLSEDLRWQEYTELYKKRS